MDGEQGEGGGGAGGGGAGADAIIGAGGGGGEPSWRDTLAEEYRGAPEIQNYATLDEAMKGLIESKKAATARVPDFKSEEGLQAFAAAVRPGDATEYEIPVPEGQPTILADKFRAFAHEIGMPPAWAKAIAEFNNSANAEMIAAEEAKGQADVETLKGAMGADKFDAALKGVQAMLPAFGVEMQAEDLAKLDAKLGSGNLLKFLFEVQARVGEPGVIENTGGAGNTGALNPAQAQERWNLAIQDKGWRAQAKVAGTPEFRESQRLTMLIAQGKNVRPK